MPNAPWRQRVHRPRADRVCNYRRRRRLALDTPPRGPPAERAL